MSAKLLLSIYAFLVGSLLPATVFAADDKQQWWGVLLAFLIKAFVAIAVPVLTATIVALANRWKLKLEHDKVQTIAAAAVGFAEQKALNALKDGKDKTPGAEKLKLALDFANGLAEQYKLKQKAADKLSDLIEAALGKHNMENGGS